MWHVYVNMQVWWSWCARVLVCSARVVGVAGVTGGVVIVSSAWFDEWLEIRWKIRVEDPLGTCCEFGRKMCCQLGL